MSWWLIGLIVVLILIIIALSAYKMVGMDDLNHEGAGMVTSIPGGFVICPWGGTYIIGAFGHHMCASARTKQFLDYYRMNRAA
jgi:hypothetical protein